MRLGEKYRESDATAEDEQHNCCAVCNRVVEKEYLRVISWNPRKIYRQ